MMIEQSSEHVQVDNIAFSIYDHFLYIFCDQYPCSQQVTLLAFN